MQKAGTAELEKTATRSNISDQAKSVKIFRYIPGHIGGQDDRQDLGECPCGRAVAIAGGLVYDSRRNAANAAAKGSETASGHVL